MTNDDQLDSRAGLAGGGDGSNGGGDGGSGAGGGGGGAGDGGDGNGDGARLTRRQQQAELEDRIRRWPRWPSRVRVSGAMELAISGKNYARPVVIDLSKNMDFWPESYRSKLSDAETADLAELERLGGFFDPESLPKSDYRAAVRNSAGQITHAGEEGLAKGLDRDDWELTAAHLYTVPRGWKPGWKPKEPKNPKELDHLDVLFIKQRYEQFKDGKRLKKDLRSVSWDGEGWNFRIGQSLKKERSRPLYNLPQVMAWSTLPVILVEGEKVADAMLDDQHVFNRKGNLASRSVIASFADARHSARLVDFSPLVGREVILCGDRDDAGRDWVNTVARELYKQGVNDLFIFGWPGNVPDTVNDFADDLPEWMTAPWLCRHMTYWPRMFELRIRTSTDGKKWTDWRAWKPGDPVKSQEDRVEMRHDLLKGYLDQFVLNQRTNEWYKVARVPNILKNKPPVGGFLEPVAIKIDEIVHEANEAHQPRGIPADTVKGLARFSRKYNNVVSVVNRADFSLPVFYDPEAGWTFNLFRTKGYVPITPDPARYKLWGLFHSNLAGLPRMKANVKTRDGKGDWQYAGERFLEHDEMKCLLARLNRKADGPTGQPVGERDPEAWAVYLDRSGKPLRKDCGAWPDNAVTRLDAKPDLDFEEDLASACKDLLDKATQYTVFMCILKTTIFDRTTKVMMIVTFMSSAGIGKDKLMEMLGDVVTYAAISADDLVKDFNDFADKKAVLINELHRVPEKLMQSIKANSTISRQTVNSKYERKKLVWSLTTYFGATNFENFARLEPDDRRFFCIDAFDNKPLKAKQYSELEEARKYVDEYVGFINGEADWAVNEYGLDYNPFAPAPMTEAKRRLMDDSKSFWGQQMEEFVNSPWISEKPADGKVPTIREIGGFNLEMFKVWLESRTDLEQVMNKGQRREDFIKRSLREFDRATKEIGAFKINKPGAETGTKLTINGKITRKKLYFLPEVFGDNPTAADVEAGISTYNRQRPYNTAALSSASYRNTDVM